MCEWNTLPFSNHPVRGESRLRTYRYRYRIGVVDAFLRVLRVVQNIVGNAVAGLAVFPIKLGDRMFRTVKKQSNNCLVIHPKLTHSTDIL